MVLTQLQLKWPNHSTQLLTGLKYLFKNEQLVDCTLKCNKHTLKVHRSVLAACSPYFERELENSPLVVIKDMQFNVLQALIEFMYYGETRITEENLTSLIEAAKLFEIKGLSEMDLLTSNENSVVPSVVAVNKNCAVEGPFVSEIKDIFEKYELKTTDATLKSPIDEAISANVPNQCLSDGDDSNSNLIGESTTSQSHSSRNFVITPPQTESAQILLSLAACSYSQKPFMNPVPNGDAVVSEELQNGDDVNHHPNVQNNLLYDASAFIMPETITSSSSSGANSIVINSAALSHSSLQHRSLAAAGSVVDFIDTSGATDSTKQNGVDVSVAQPQQQSRSSSVDSSDSLLAKLLTRSNQISKASSNGSGSLIGSTRYENLYDVVLHSDGGRNQDAKCATRVAVASTTNSHSSPMPAMAVATAVGEDLQNGLILDCPFLIETPSGLVDMLNVFDGDVFAAQGKNTVKIIPREEVVSLADSHRSTSAIADAASAVGGAACVDEQHLDDAVLERIQQDTEDELKDDPEAVVLTRVTDDGRLEQFVLSSADVNALQQMNEQRRKRRKAEGDGGAAAALLTPSAAHVDYESSLGGCSGDAPASLITRIVQFGAPVDRAISKLPFKKSSRPPSSLSADSNGLPATGAAGVGGTCAVSSETLLAEAAFDQHHQPHAHHQSDHHHHHHENMFEELDSQFNMDCSIEHIQRDYVAYEEASKNETQLEHNYYANALKDEDEECVEISAGENYMMLLEEPLTNGNGLADKDESGAASYHRHIIGATDVYLNNEVVASEKKELAVNSRRNGLVIAAPAASVSSTTSGDSAGGDKRLFNGDESDLILSTVALMSSVMAPAIAVDSRRLTNGTSKNGLPAAVTARTAKSRVVGRAAAAAATTSSSSELNTLPFKPVKNTNSQKKPRRTYKRKATAETNSRSSTVASSSAAKRSKESAALNGGLAFADSSLVEEIIVDEIS